MGFWDIDFKGDATKYQTNEQQLISLLYGIDVFDYVNETLLQKAIDGKIQEKKDVLYNHILPPFEYNSKKLLKDCNIIEIGPGNGVMVNELAPQVKFIHLVDISKSIMESCANQTINRDNVSYNVIFGKLDLSSIEDIDFVYSQSVFIHFTLFDVYLYFEELKKCLNPNGMVYIDIIDTENEYFVDFFYGETFQKQLKDFKKVYNTTGTQTNTKTLFSPLPLSRVEELVGKLGFSLIHTEPAVENPTTALLFKLKDDK